jgi:hypothetical protein
MIGIISIFFSILTAIFTYLLKEPEFLKDIEDDFAKQIIDLAKPETLKLMTKTHLICGVKNLYKEINAYKPILLSIIIGIVGVGAILSLTEYMQKSTINDTTITVFSVFVLAFMSITFMFSLYLNLFCQIIKKI